MTYYESNLVEVPQLVFLINYLLIILKYHFVHYKVKKKPIEVLKIKLSDYYFSFILNVQLIQPILNNFFFLIKINNEKDYQ